MTFPRRTTLLLVILIYSSILIFFIYRLLVPFDFSKKCRMNTRSISVLTRKKNHNPKRYIYLVYPTDFKILS